MKLGIVISVSESETAWNALRLGNFSLGLGDTVSVFFVGPGVDCIEASTDKFNVKEQAESLLAAGGVLLACGSCLAIRKKEGSEVCPLSTMKDLYELIRDSDKVVSF